MIIQSIALLAAALFTGAAAYITLVEQPVRLTLPPAAMLEQWRMSYDRAAPLQAGLAIVSGAAAIWAWWLGGGPGWLIGALLILANWPFTFITIMPTNNRLKKLSDAGNAQPLIRQWGRLHAGRTALGIAATLVFIRQIV